MRWRRLVVHDVVGARSPVLDGRHRGRRRVVDVYEREGALPATDDRHLALADQLDLLPAAVIARAGTVEEPIAQDDPAWPGEGCVFELVDRLAHLARRGTNQRRVLGLRPWIEAVGERNALGDEPRCPHFPRRLRQAPGALAPQAVRPSDPLAVPARVQRPSEVGELVYD